jgi:hypothetical protein
VVIVFAAVRVESDENNPCEGRREEGEERKERRG